MSPDRTARRINIDKSKDAPRIDPKVVAETLGATSCGRTDELLKKLQIIRDDETLPQSVRDAAKTEMRKISYMRHPLP